MCDSLAEWLEQRGITLDVGDGTFSVLWDREISLMTALRYSGHDWCFRLAFTDVFLPALQKATNKMYASLGLGERMALRSQRVSIIAIHDLLDASPTSQWVSIVAGEVLKYQQFADAMKPYASSDAEYNYISALTMAHMEAA